MSTVVRSIPIRAALVVATLLLSACGSPFVGDWKSAGAGETVVRIQPDHTYTAKVAPREGAVKGSSGSWEKDSDKRIRLIQRTGDWPRVVEAELTGGKTLEIFGEGVATTLKKE